MGVFNNMFNGQNNQYGNSYSNQYNNQYGSQYGNQGVRVTKSAVYQMLQDYCYQQTGIYVSKMEKIQECPSAVRHACVDGGITMLPQYYISIPTANGNIVVYYYFCRLCGKLFIFDDFM